MTRFLLWFFLPFAGLTAFSQKDCLQQQYQLQLLQKYPQLSTGYNSIETFTQSALPVLSGINGSGTGDAVPAIITIPVVVHVLWNSNMQNISDAQIQSQLDVLNADYSGNNADRSKIPSYFAGLAADCGIQFALAKSDPRGNSTAGIVRKQTAIQSFGFDDAVKHAANGGDDAWDADSYLNIWVCNMAGGIQGYSSIPGSPKDIDGVVINAGVFGTINMNAPFNKGRTTVHEIGHWLNLRHIWGDAACGDDKVDDTPAQQAATRGCVSGEKFSCGSTTHGDMYMNYMDFTDDACMFMFTNGQRDRMRKLFEAGGPRNAILLSNGLKGDGLPLQTPPVQGLVVMPDFNVVLYPNPASSGITIHAKEGIDYIGKSIIIYNRIGQAVKTVMLTAAQQQIDISNLQNGLYFIRIDGIKAKAMTKFVKQ
jgi:Pregnancy-associated plasma protein-A/Secretion system C-terminal sorting domain